MPPLQALVKPWHVTFGYPTGPSWALIPPDSIAFRSPGIGALGEGASLEPCWRNPGAGGH